MPEIFIDGRAIQAERGQTVMQAAVANGIEMAAFCWHPELSVAGNCRICAIQVEGRSWVEIACNMPVSEGLRVLTNSELVTDYRKSLMRSLKKQGLLFAYAFRKEKHEIDGLDVTTYYLLSV